MATQTSKFDWYTIHLSQQTNVLVSDDDFLLKLCNVKSDGEFSIRFIGNVSMGFQLFLIIKNDDLNFLANQTTALNKLIDLLNNLLAVQLKVIICKSSLSTDIGTANFNLYKRETSAFHLCDGNNLAMIFSQLDSKYTENAGEAKAINRTVNDDFQLFTRAKLSRYLIANDLDAIVLENDQTTKLFRIERILELKRIDINYNTVETWRPYIQDFSNYMAVRYICNNSRANDRTIVYYADLKNGTNVGVHTITSMSKVNIMSQSIVVPYVNAITTNP